MHYTHSVNVMQWTNISTSTVKFQVFGIHHAHCARLAVCISQLLFPSTLSTFWRCMHGFRKCFFILYCIVFMFVCSFVRFSPFFSLTLYQNQFSLSYFIESSKSSAFISAQRTLLFIWGERASSEITKCSKCGLLLLNSHPCFFLPACFLAWANKMCRWNEMNFNNYLLTFINYISYGNLIGCAFCSSSIYTVGGWVNRWLFGWLAGWRNSYESSADKQANEISLIKAPKTPRCNWT